MRVRINLEKSLHQNAAEYFEKAKKAKRKLAGIEKAITGLNKKIEAAKEKKADMGAAEIIKKRKKAWFEKFHWFESSDGLLVIGGRDAKSNEAVVKKHMAEGDIYFHADIRGAPHVVVKTSENKAPETTMNEAALFAAAFSKAWKEGLASVDVYSVLPEQVSKKAPAGEAMGSGAFMIYGERRWFRKTTLGLAAGVKKEGNEYVVICGPAGAVKKRAIAFTELKQGRKSKGEIAKRLKREWEAKTGMKCVIDLDEIIQMLPAGGFEAAD